jgi:hypothetical protein
VTPAPFGEAESIHAAITAGSWRGGRRDCGRV